MACVGGRQGATRRVRTIGGHVAVGRIVEGDEVATRQGDEVSCKGRHCEEQDGAIRWARLNGLESHAGFRSNERDGKGMGSTRQGLTAILERRECAEI